MKINEILLLLIVLVTDAFSQWYHYVVDSVSENLLPRIVTTARIPHVAFYADSRLEYAVWDSGTWVMETIDIASSYHNGNPSLVFDQEGQPHIAWFRGTPWYAHWDGAAWQTEEIDPDSGGDYISMVLDSAGFPSVAYTKRRGLFDNMLKFAIRDSQGWHPILLDSSGGVDCVLAIDTLSRFCIAHCESWSDGALFFHSQTDSGWIKETVVPDHTSQCKMVLDENGDPHISYYWADGSAYDMRYAERVSRVWRFDIIDPGQQTSKRGWDNWIVRDQSGIYHLSYHAHNELQLRYAWGTYGNWQVEIVNSVGGWNLGSSIDLDELDRPCIAYVNENQANRLYVSTRYDLTAIPDKNKDMTTKMKFRIPPVVRSMLFIPLASGVLFDVLGRQVLDLNSGLNDISHLAPGVYFVRMGLTIDWSTVKVVIQK